MRLRRNGGSVLAVELRRLATPMVKAIDTTPLARSGH